MARAEQPSMYRVRPAGPARWEVFRGESVHPLASFTDKNSAVDYAMGLARGRVTWQSVLGHRAEPMQTVGPAVPASRA